MSERARLWWCGSLTGRYIQLSGATKSVNRQLEAKTRALAGWKGYADGGVMPTGAGSCLVGAVPGLDCSA
jgi:hypothetical protein